MFFRLWMK
uniref:Uncharacterized protein n=1 Tax=Anguilla anguilla TaxID=7936 RepID=A0A0E9U7C5_ANGAN